MSRLCFSLLFLLPALALPVLFSPALQSREAALGQPIIDGVESEARDRPWMAALLRADDPDSYSAQVCGASLIDPSWAITAAHCVYDGPGSSQTGFDILLRASDLTDPAGLRQPVAEIIIHPDFVPPTAESSGISFNNDIALLRLAHPVKGVIPVDIPGQLFDGPAVPPGSMATVLGWGARSYDKDRMHAGDFPLRLQELQLPIVTAAECARVMGQGRISAAMLCAGRLESGADSCVGDSGGPLIVRADTPSGYLQLGLVSWGLGCGRPGNYGVYTRLGKYASWITQQTCGAGQIPPTPEPHKLYHLYDANSESFDGKLLFLYGSSSDAVRYRLYYAPSATLYPIRYLEMGTQTWYLGQVPEEYTVMLRSYRGICNSGYSALTRVGGP